MSTIDLTTVPGRNDFFTMVFDSVESTLVNLFQRWQDEKDHEDIEKYKEVLWKVLKEKLPEGSFPVNMTKRPFGIVVSVPNCPYEVCMFIQMGRRGWKPVK